MEMIINQTDTFTKPNPLNDGYAYTGNAASSMDELFA